MQQLSLPLELLDSKPKNANWFENILTTLEVKQEPDGLTTLVNLSVNGCGNKASLRLKHLACFLAVVGWILRFTIQDLK
jgi:hypothetical protein